MAYPEPSERIFNEEQIAWVWPDNTNELASNADSENLSESAQCSSKTASFSNYQMEQSELCTSPMGERNNLTSNRSDLSNISETEKSDSKDCNKCVLPCQENLSYQTSSESSDSPQTVISCYSPHDNAFSVCPACPSSKVAQVKCIFLSPHDSPRIPPTVPLFVDTELANESFESSILDANRINQNLQAPPYSVCTSFDDFGLQQTHSDNMAKPHCRPIEEYLANLDMESTSPYLIAHTPQQSHQSVSPQKDVDQLAPYVYPVDDQAISLGLQIDAPMPKTSNLQENFPCKKFLTDQIKSMEGFIGHVVSSSPADLHENHSDIDQLAMSDGEKNPSVHDCEGISANQNTSQYGVCPKETKMSCREQASADLCYEGYCHQPVGDYEGILSEGICSGLSEDENGHIVCDSSHANVDTSSSFTCNRSVEDENDSIVNLPDESNVQQQMLSMNCEAVTLDYLPLYQTYVPPSTHQEESSFHSIPSGRPIFEYNDTEFQLAALPYNESYQNVVLSQSMVCQCVLCIQPYRVQYFCSYPEEFPYLHHSYQYLNVDGYLAHPQESNPPSISNLMTESHSQPSSQVIP